MKPYAEVQAYTTTSNSGVLTAPAEPLRRHTRPHKNMRVTLNLPVALLDQLRNAVYWTPGMTLTGLIKGAIHESLDRLEARRGQPFPLRLSELKCGRPRTRSMSSGPPPSKGSADVAARIARYQKQVGSPTTLAS